MSEREMEGKSGEETEEEIAELFAEYLMTVLDRLIAEGVDLESLDPEDIRILFGDRPPEWRRDEDGKLQFVFHRGTGDSPKR